MCGDIESGSCQYCDYTGPINRKYYRYDIPCECHSPKHFEIVFHCNNCVPKEPETTKITMKTKSLTAMSKKEKGKRELQQNERGLTEGCDHCIYRNDEESEKCAVCDFCNGNFKKESVYFIMCSDGKTFANITLK